jgi:uncharacterized protein (DUF362 family)
MSSIPRVTLVRDSRATYPSRAPFDPGEPYPELAGLQGHDAALAEPNPAYRLVRLAFLTQGLDAPRAGTPSWNPLGGFVPRTGSVLIKPNLVLETGQRREEVGQSVVTHGSVIRAIYDYVRLAGGPAVRIVIGDVPLQGADFDAIVTENGLRRTVEELRDRGDTRVELLDLRRERAVVDESGFIDRLEPLTGDPLGYVEVDLAARSRLEGLPANHFEGFAVSDYAQGSTRQAHAAGRHTYLIPRTVLDAALIVNVPKLKTHQKAGLTVALKNLVGINGDKSRIPHFRMGGVTGDEYPRNQVWLRALSSGSARILQRRSKVLYRAARLTWRKTRRFLISRSAPEAAAGAATLVGGGSWHGNDTLWRALHDLNHLVLFADAEGQLRTQRQRAYLCVVDGIVAGEGDGPLFPRPRREGVVIVGDDALAVDLTAARYMGYDWRRIPQLAAAIAAKPEWTSVRAPIEEGGVAVAGISGSAWQAEPPFEAPPGWLDHLARRVPADLGASKEEAVGA